MKLVTPLLTLSWMGILMAGQPPQVPVTTGPPVGARVPQFQALDQAGHAQDLKSILRSKGALLVFFRSADW